MPDLSRPLESIAIAGPGAIGSLLAAMLTRAGNHVCLLDHRDERAGILQREGIHIHEDGSDWQAHPLVSTDPAVIQSADLVVFCVKAYSTETLCHSIAPHVKPDSIILSLQNGLGNVERILSLPVRTVLAGSTGMGALLDKTGQVISTGKGKTWIATARNGLKECRTVVDLLRKAGIEADIHHDLNAMLWFKLILNATVNPLTAYYRILNGELLSHPQAGPLARRLLSEGVTVANALGMKLDSGQMLEALETLCRKTASNRSSMLQDIDNGRNTELDAITGALVKNAESTGIPVPNHQWILQNNLNPGTHPPRPITITNSSQIGRMERIESTTG